MTMTTRIQSVSVPVSDQDKALAFYTDVLGCELVWDGEGLPGNRMVIVRPPGSEISIVLLPPDSQIPLAIRFGTDDAQAAHDRLRRSEATIHNDEVLHLPGSPAMFAFADPDGNALVYLEEGDQQY